MEMNLHPPSQRVLVSSGYGSTLFVLRIDATAFAGRDDSAAVVP